MYLFPAQETRRFVRPNMWPCRPIRWVLSLHDLSASIFHALQLLFIFCISISVSDINWQFYFIARLWGNMKIYYPKKNHVSRGKFDFLGIINLHISQTFTHKRFMISNNIWLYIYKIRWFLIVVWFFNSNNVLIFFPMLLSLFSIINSSHRQLDIDLYLFEKNNNNQIWLFASLLYLKIGTSHILRYLSQSHNKDTRYVVCLNRH